MGIVFRYYESPFGQLVLASCGDALVMCDCPWSASFERNRARIEKGLGARFEEGNDAVLDRAATELDAYFRGELREFSVPLRFVGTEFQKKVWMYLCTIPYGSTVTYARQAEAIGLPGGGRAAGSADGANAICIFAPCHRVTGRGGALTGYAGGLAMKQALLSLEGIAF